MRRRPVLRSGLMCKGMTMNRRFTIEAVLAAASGVLAVLAVLWPTWLESIGFDLDGGDSGAEWAIPTVLAVIAVVLTGAARRHWKLGHTALRPADALER